MFARVENGVTKISPKNRKRLENAKILDQKQQFEFPMREFSFFGRGKTNFFWGGGGVLLQNWLASNYPGAYTSMPQPLFGAKDVCYTEK